MSHGEIEAEKESKPTTEVTVRCTGHIRDALGEASLMYRFEGSTLKDFLQAFFSDYDVQDMVLATDEQAESAPGWAPAPEELPGTWQKNPEKEQVRQFARVLVNGTFNEHLDGFETELKDGDRVSLLYPFMFCV